MGIVESKPKKPDVVQLAVVPMLRLGSPREIVREWSEDWAFRHGRTPQEGVETELLLGTDVRVSVCCAFVSSGGQCGRCACVCGLEPPTHRRT
jgi:hypothetical protein